MSPSGYGVSAEAVETGPICFLGVANPEKGGGEGPRRRRSGEPPTPTGDMEPEQLDAAFHARRPPTHVAISRLRSKADWV